MVLCRQALAEFRIVLMAVFSFNREPKATSSTSFSEFIRTASSAEKKRVYKRVLEKATERQNRVLDRAAAADQVQVLPFVGWITTGKICSRSCALMT